jgi:hypothetical protein
MKFNRLVLVNALISMAMAACVVPSPVPDAAVTEKYADSASGDVYRKVSSEYAAARAQRLKFFAPEQFSRGATALSKANSLRNAKADDMEVLKQLYIAEKQLDICRQVKIQAEKQMPEVLAALQTLEDKSITKSYPFEFEMMKRETSRLLGDIEGYVLGEPVKAKKDSVKDKAKLMQAINELEIKVVKHNTLNEADIVLTKVESMGGKRLAPKTYQQAKQALQAANDIIEKNVKDEKAIEQAGQAYKFAVFHVLHVARTVDQLESLDRSGYEDYVLDLENRLAAVAQAFDQRDIRNHALHEQIQVLTGLARRTMTEKANLVQAQGNTSPAEIAETGNLDQDHKKALQKIQQLSQQIIQLQNEQESFEASATAEGKRWKRKAALLEQQLSKVTLENNDLRTQRDSLQNQLNAAIAKNSNAE